MPNSAKQEAWVGSVAAIIIFGVITYAFIGPGVQDPKHAQGLYLTAEFGRIDGLVVGSPVRLAGIDIGIVDQVSLTDSQRAEITIIIYDSDFLIPTDTAAVIETDGLFGEKYVELHPGGELEAFVSGQRISYSQDSVVLETLLNQVVARANSDQQSSEDANNGGEPK